MRFVSFSEASEYLRGKKVAIVGSAPTVLDNAPRFVDSHEVVVRVNNYKLGPAQGFRCDVHYSFYGTSIKKSVEELRRDGVRLCMCKLPDAKPLESAWHEQHGKLEGIDYRYIYRHRASWWFCDTYIPDVARFMEKFALLGNYQPTTGFAAILDVLACEPCGVYLTGFDFFDSGLHNVDELWHAKNLDDPIRHRPDLEALWLRKNARAYPLAFDAKLTRILA
ncbi:MAG: hypothetical protein HY661_07570 [Betaproteobacteria bacterium]|nr:hypothetical protein [Betaproteobacteria bacterium]